MECPNCGSQDIRRLSHDRRQRTAERETTRGGTSASGHDAAHHQLNSGAQSRIQPSKDAASRFNAFAGARGILIALVIAYIVLRVLTRIAGIASLGPFGPLMVILILGTAVWLFISYPQRPEYRAARAEWEDSWSCSQCGTKFVP